MNIGLSGAIGFREYISSLGYEPPSVIEPGRWFRFSTNGKRGDTAGSARLFPDCEGGIVYDWRSGECQTWQAKRERPRDEAEMRALQQRIEKNRLEAQEERERESKATAERARKIWADATPATDDHPYLKKKGIAAHGVRVYRGPLAVSEMRCDGAIVVPGRDSGGDICTLSFISPDGEKRYLPGPRPRGCYFPIGKPGGVMCIAEGFATAASVHAATGHAVAVAFDAGNLEPAARAIAAKLPDAEIIVCADNDLKPGGPNVGVEAAMAAAACVNGKVAIPEMNGRKCDFNDMALEIGIKAVARTIESATTPHAAPSSEAIGPAPLGLSSRVELIRADAITPEPVAWLMPGYLARGKVHVMAGAPSTGKTTLVIGLIATVTSGGRWPDGGRAKVGAALIWSGEDSPADTLVPRLMAAGADLSKVHFVGAVQGGTGTRPFDPAQDFATLDQEARSIPDLAIVLVDPIVSAIAGDGHKGNDVRRGLQPLVDFAHRTHCAVVGISHFSKGTAGRDPVERVTGSIAFGALARVVLATAKLPESDGGGRIMVRAKSNLGPDGGGFRYSITPVEIRGPKGPITTTRPEWLDPLEGEARDLLATAETVSDPEERSELDDCKAFLRSMLDEGPVKAKQVRADAEGAGFSNATLKRAARALGILHEKGGMKEGWTWAMPPSAPPKVLKNYEDAQAESVSNFGADEHLRQASSDVEVF